LGSKFVIPSRGSVRTIERRSIPAMSPGPNRAMFKIAHDCGASLTGWANCRIVVTFRPSSPGAKSATLRLTTGNGLLRYRPLSGNGLSAGPSLTLAPGSLSFGDQQAQTGGAAKTVTFQNTGTN
jgi:hypothetical protein